MDKLFLFPAFAVFALVACSDDKPPPSHYELCAKKTITKDCLAGKWNLERIEGSPECSSNGGILKLKANGEFSFENGNVTAGGKEFNGIEANGSWKLTETGTVMEIICSTGICTVEDEPFNVAIDVKNPQNLKVTHSGYPSFLGICMGSSINFTEVFSWQGSN
jgi:hypothetical protein